MGEFRDGFADPNEQLRFHRLCDGLSHLAKAHATAELFEFGEFLLTHGSAGMGITPLSEKLLSLRESAARLCHLYAGRTDAWRLLCESMRGCKWDRLVTNESSGRVWSEHNAYRAVEQVLQAGRSITCDNVEQARQNLLQAARCIAVWRSELAYAAQPKAPTPCSPLYDERLREQALEKELDGVASRKREEQLVDVENAINTYLERLVARVRQRQAAQVPPRKPPPMRRWWHF